jgi:hypothetical protein
MLMDDTPALAPEYVYYQRLVARDQSEAAELIDNHIKTQPPQSVYDLLLLPALSYAERDRLERRLSREEEMAVVEATRELVTDAAEAIRLHTAKQPPAAARSPDASPEGSPGGAAEASARISPAASPEPLRVLGYAVNGLADEVALAMLARMIDDLPIVMEVTATRMQAAELALLVKDRQFSAVCFVDLPPSSSSKTRYLVRRLRAARPELHIAVGRWAPPALADESPAPLVAAGADHVASLLVESRNYLAGLTERLHTFQSDPALPCGTIQSCTV